MVLVLYKYDLHLTESLNTVEYGFSKMNKCMYACVYKHIYVHTYTYVYIHAHVYGFTRALAA